MTANTQTDDDVRAAIDRVRDEASRARRLADEETGVRTTHTCQSRGTAGSLRCQRDLFRNRFVRADGTLEEEYYCPIHGLTTPQ